MSRLSKYWFLTICPVYQSWGREKLFIYKVEKNLIDKTDGNYILVKKFWKYLILSVWGEILVFNAVSSLSNWWHEKLFNDEGETNLMDTRVVNMDKGEKNS